MLHNDRTVLGFPWLAILLAIGFAIAWTSVGLRHNNVERQGIDIINHARIIYQTQVPDGFSPYWLGWLAEYPKLSHQTAALFLPLFDGDAIQALRCAALASLLLILIAQGWLLRCFLPWPIALVVLVVWQWLATHLNVANVSHFLWEGQYNYSRAAGAAAYWLMLVALVARPLVRDWRLTNHVLAIGLASYALGCHLAPGVVGFGTLGAVYLLAVCRAGSRESVAGLVGLLGTAGYLYFGTQVWELHFRLRGDDGWLPVKLLPLLTLWLPTWAYLVLTRGRAVLLRERDDRPWSGLSVLSAGLLAAGALQAYLAVTTFGLGRTAPYVYKTALFFTTPLTSLLWLAWGVEAFRRWQPSWREWADVLLARRHLQVAAVGVAIVGVIWVLKKDAGRAAFGVQRDPAHVVRALAEHRQHFQGFYYYDAEQPFASYYASSLGLDPRIAWPCWRTIYDTKDPRAVFADHRVRGFLLPAGADTSALLPEGEWALTPVGPFEKCEPAQPQMARLRAPTHR